MAVIQTVKDVRASKNIDVSSAGRPAWLGESLYPFESRYLELDGCRLHYVDEGKGPVLLFLHAAPSWSFIYRNFIKGLRGQFRCVALDYPGFGFSTAPKGYGYTLPEHSSVVERFIEALNLKDLTMLVHDSGGPIGLRIAGDHPDRFKALILTDTFGWPLSDYPNVVRMLKFVSGRAFGFFNQSFNLLPWVVGAVAPGRRKLPKAERAAYTNAFPTPESRRRILRLFRDLVEREDYMRGVEQGLRCLKDLPVLLIYGEKDPARLIGWQARFEGMFPRHRSVVIKGEGHFPHEGAPDEMIDAIRGWWLGEVLKDAGKSA